MWELLCYVLCFFAEGITAWAYFERVFEKKKISLSIKLLFVVGYALLFVISQMDSVVINGIFFVIINCVLLFLCYSCKIWTGVIQVGYLTFVMGGTEILMALLLSYFYRDFAAFKNDLSVMVTFTVVGRLLYFSVMQISARYIRPVKGYKNVSAVALLAIMPLGSVLISIAFIHVGMTTTVTSITRALMTASVLALLLINIFVVVIYNQTQLIHNEHLELELISQKMEINTQSYEMLQEQYNDQRVLIHDIRRHLNIMNGLAKENKIQELEEYLNEIEDNPALQRVIRICDNQILNMILVRYAGLCKENNIDFDFDIRIDDLHGMSSYDLTAIFDNLLSNAFESAKESEIRSLDLRVMPQAENRILITLINSCDIPPEMSSNGEIRTRKVNKEQHGIGIKSIMQAVKKYAGISKMYYDPDSHKFHSIIQLTVQSK